MIYDVGIAITGPIYIEVMAGSDRDAREKALAYLAEMCDISCARTAITSTELPPEKNVNDFSSHEEEIYP